MGFSTVWSCRGHRQISTSFPSSERFYKIVERGNQESTIVRVFVSRFSFFERGGRIDVCCGNHSALA
jgi:hypothetical protein